MAEESIQTNVTSGTMRALVLLTPAQYEQARVAIHSQNFSPQKHKTIRVLIHPALGPLFPAISEDIKPPEMIILTWTYHDDCGAWTPDFFPRIIND